MKRPDKYEYIKNYYGVPIRKDAPITYKGKPGVVTGVESAYAMIKLNGESFSKPYQVDFDPGMA